MFESRELPDQGAPGSVLAISEEKNQAVMFYGITLPFSIFWHLARFAKFPDFPDPPKNSNVLQEHYGNILHIFVTVTFPEICARANTITTTQGLSGQKTLP